MHKMMWPAAAIAAGLAFWVSGAVAQMGYTPPPPQQHVPGSHPTAPSSGDSGSSRGIGSKSRIRSAFHS